MAAALDLDMEQIPIAALRTSTREVISTLLNPKKVIPTDDGLQRDWRGLAQLTGVPGEMVRLIATKPDPTAQVLDQWKQGTLGVLVSMLGQLDRWDVVDDTAELMEYDASLFLQRKEATPTSAAELNSDVDKQILTIADVHRLEQGLEPQHYDAFLLFAEEDEDFAMEIVYKMESFYGLKLCYKERDLVGGVTFEHEAILRLIAQRCNRLIVVASPNFVKSEANKFFVTFATALGIDQRLRKVVPVKYQPCMLPPELTYYFWLDFTRAGKLYDFWTKLYNSVVSASSASAQGISYARVTELPSAPRLALPSAPRAEVPAIKENGEKYHSTNFHSRLEENKLDSYEWKKKDLTDSESLCSEVGSTSSSMLEVSQISLLKKNKSMSVESLKKNKSMSVESLKNTSPVKWLKKKTPKFLRRKPQLAEAT